MTDLRAAPSDAQEFLARSPVGHKVVDRSWRYVYVNPAGAAMTGHHPEELVGRVLWEEFPELLGSSFEPLLRSAMDDGAAGEATIFLASTGRWYRLRAFPSASGVGMLVDDVSDARARDDALQISEDRYGLILDAVAAGVWDLDVRSGDFHVSPRMRAIYGLGADTPITPDAMLEMVHPDDRASLFPSPPPGPGGSHDFVADYRVRRATDGVERWCRCRGRVQADAAGRLVRSVGTVVDITEERHAQQELAKLQRQLEEAQRLAAIGSWSWDVGTGEVIWSAETFHLLGVDGDTAPSFDLVLTMAVDEPARQRFLDRVQRALDGTEPYDFQSPLRRADGAVRIVHTRAVVERDATGRPLRMTGTMQDVTEARDRERALRESEGRFRTLVEASPHGVFLTDAPGNATYANARLLAMFDLDGPAFLAGRWLDQVHADDRERVIASAQRAVLGQVPFAEEYRIQVRGEERRVRVTTSPFHGPEGAYGGQVGNVEDVTAERRAAEERTLLEAQVQQAQKLESLGILAGGIAHDFNNMLVGILTNASHALDALPAEATEVRAVLADIEQAGRRAADLTRQLLAYSGRARFVVEPVSLSDVTREMTQLLRAALGAGARLELHLADDLPLVRADVTQVRQVVLNLITNAADALEGRAGRIVVHTGVRTAAELPADAAVFGGPPPAGRCVVLEVRDDGVGMSPETLARIFDPFFTTKFTGRGLGLAATLGIMRGHEGAIAVRTALGGGTSFMLLFPPDAAAAAPSRPSPALGVRLTGVPGQVVMVVDDDATVRRVVERTVRRLGFEVVPFAGGAEALAWLDAHPAPTLILLDLTMPEMSGRDVLQQVRARHAGQRVVLMSGYTEQDVSADRETLGVTGFLQKPFTTAELSAALAAAMPA